MIIKIKNKTGEIIKKILMTFLNVGKFYVHLIYLCLHLCIQVYLFIDLYLSMFITSFLSISFIYIILFKLFIKFIY